jgi:hypothetical protein
VLVDVRDCAGGVGDVGWRCGLTAVEVDERLLCDLGLDVALVLGLLQLLDGGVVGGHVGVVVLGVVQLHDLAADGGLEGAVVVYVNLSVLWR